MKRALLVASTFVLLVACAPLIQRHEYVMYKTFEIQKVLDGKFDKSVVTFSETGHEGAVAITEVVRHEGQKVPSGAEAVHLLLAFQLSEGKTAADFAAFKKHDLPWVASNHGANPATYFTRRDGTWEFDAFEDATFATMDDFKRAYAGNEEMTKAGEGLFGPKVLVAVIK